MINSFPEKLIRTFPLGWGADINESCFSAVTPVKGRNQFKLQYDNDIDKFLDSIYAAGADLTGSDIEQRAKSIARSNQMLKLLESSIDLLRNNHKHGEQYYWILYYAFLSPQEMKNTDEILDKLAHHITNISYRTYYRKRRAAIEALSTILWGFTAKETLDTLNKFFPE